MAKINKEFNLLTLDPMYSPLHSMIADSVAINKYCILSCFALSIYLPGFNVLLASKMIKDYKAEIPDGVIEKVSRIKSYYSLYVQKRDKRDLNNDELRYMASFYLVLREFLISKDIQIVLLHNDTRWFHAVAIHLCKELGIRYIVTEQGLYRPYTTVIDTEGCNANSSLRLNAEKYDYPVVFNGFDIPDKFHPHESLLSRLVFGAFLALHMLERPFGTRLPYRHTKYPIKKYIHRLVKKNRPSSNIHHLSNTDNPIVLLLLQIEDDSQILIHSDIESNQKLIRMFEDAVSDVRMQLVVKPHPSDIKTYQYATSTLTSNEGVTKLASLAEMVFTVNSSAALQVLDTNTPLYLLGDSIYEQDGVADKIELTDVPVVLRRQQHKQNFENRKNYTNYLKAEYLLDGAGFSFKRSSLNNKLRKILEIE